MATLYCLARRLVLALALAAAAGRASRPTSETLERLRQLLKAEELRLALGEAAASEDSPLTVLEKRYGSLANGPWKRASDGANESEAGQPADLAADSQTVRAAPAGDGQSQPRPSKRQFDPNGVQVSNRQSDPRSTSAGDANVDVFGAPLNPEDFTKAQRLELSLPEQAPDGFLDPIEMAELYEGDIMEEVAFDAMPRSATRQPDELWPRAEIPYVIASGFSADERAVIASAVLAFERDTCIRVVPLRPGSGSRDGHVHIIKGDGCFSSVGRKAIGASSQQLSLGSGCIFPGIVVHEFMHAAGFWHEQSRPDRDEHVIIHWDNIKAGKTYNFNKYTWNHMQNLSEPYDIGSIMHYGPHAFAADRSRPTMTAIHPSSAQMGQRSALSHIDINKLNKLYDCQGVTAPPAPVVQPVECRDNNLYCKDWASQGECTNNPLYMEVHCAHSCDTCPDGVCRDHSEFCETWADQDFCANNPSYMTVYCQKACGLCPGGTSRARCTDASPFCDAWAKSGECDINPKYMTTSCRKACGLC